MFILVKKEVTFCLANGNIMADDALTNFVQSSEQNIQFHFFATCSKYIYQLFFYLNKFINCFQKNFILKFTLVDIGCQGKAVCKQTVHFKLS